MITKIHKLAKYEHQTGNVPQYQHYVECTCGWQGRCGTEVAAKSQFDNHLQFHGNESHFSKLAESVEKEAPKTGTKVAPTNTPPPQGGLRPLGGGQGNSTV